MRSARLQRVRTCTLIRAQQRELSSAFMGKSELGIARVLITRELLKMSARSALRPMAEADIPR